MLRSPDEKGHFEFARSGFGGARLPLSRQTLRELKGGGAHLRYLAAQRAVHCTHFQRYRPCSLFILELRHALVCAELAANLSGLQLGTATTKTNTHTAGCVSLPYVVEVLITDMVRGGQSAAGSSRSLQCREGASSASARVDRTQPRQSPHPSCTQAGAAVQAGSGGGSFPTEAPSDAVLACLSKVHCLPDSAGLAGCALRGLAAIGRGEAPEVNAASNATSLVDLGRLLCDAGGTLMERAGLLKAQMERQEVCAAMQYLSFRCFCAVEVLQQAAAGVRIDAVPEGSAVWGSILEAWLCVRGGGGLEGALADLTRWWISHKAQGVDGGGVETPPFTDVGDAGTASDMAVDLASMRQQAEWLRGEAADELRSEVAAGHLESAAAAVEQLRDMAASSRVVGVRRLRPVPGMDVPDGVHCFENGTVHVLQVQEKLTPDFDTRRGEVEHWCSSVAVGAAALACSVAALKRSEGARLAQGLPRYAQSVRGAALQHLCTGASVTDPVGPHSSVALQVHCEGGWPLGQVVNDEAWVDVGMSVRQRLCRAVLGTCAAAEACGVEMVGVGLSSFVVAGVPSCSVADVAEAVEAGSCQVLLGACSGVWAGGGHGAESGVGGVLRGVLGLAAQGSAGGVSVLTGEGDAGDLSEVLECVSAGGRTSCMEAYATLCRAEGGMDSSGLAGADAAVRGASSEKLSAAAEGGGHVSPFIAACKKGNVPRVRELLALRGDTAVNVHAGDGDGPEAGFRLACVHGHVDVASELMGLDGNRAVDVRPSSSWGEVQGAEVLFAGGNFDMVRALLRARHGVQGSAGVEVEPVVVNGRAVQTALLGAQRAVQRHKGGGG